MIKFVLQLNEVDNAAAEEKTPEFGLHLDITSPGDISSFFWAHSRAPPPGLVECNVAYGRQPSCKNATKINFIISNIAFQWTCFCHTYW